MRVRPGAGSIRRRAQRHFGLIGPAALQLALTTGCQRPAEVQPARFESGAACEPQKADLIAFVNALSSSPLVTSSRSDLAESNLGRPPRAGWHLEISESGAKLEGKVLSPPGIEGLRAALTQPAKPGQRLYIAAPAQTDVRTVRSYLRAVPAGIEVELLVKVPEVPANAPGKSGPTPFAHQLLIERDPTRRAELASQGYREFSKCAAIEQAAQRANSSPPEQRWARLRAALLEVLPGCACQTLDNQNLKQIFIAEQRAGSMNIGSLPIGFLRDERCGASMPLRSMRKLVAQMESFDAEFAGNFQKEELAFSPVIDDTRLLNYFCDALPGETLAALSREGRTLYFKVPNAEGCEAVRIQPLSPGAPMGSWHRVATSSPTAAGKPTLSFHYWQGAEELRVYGPLAPDAPSSPTDTRDWTCNQNIRLTSVDPESIGLEGGRWFFSEEACRKSPSEGNVFTGCVANEFGSSP